MSRQRLRIFVSSPGDVMPARERAAQTIEKVAQIPQYARFFAIEPYLWEFEPMLAAGNFQDSIEPPSQFDVVILILESRLGTVMPERTAVRQYCGMDGRTPVTGTEWEFENALVAARERGVPDLLVYRSRRKAEVDAWDAVSRQAVFKQMEALDEFWSRHFVNRGAFVGGYADFKTAEEFAAKLENDLRRCVQRRIDSLTPGASSQSVRVWHTTPFRGLETYEFAHAQIFFGREGPIGSALLRLMTNAAAGRPFLLVLGASGSGKSSLVKAGILPRLLTPQRVSGIAFLRYVIFRPGDARADEDIFTALARCLVDGHEERTGLPELVQGSLSVEGFASHLRNASAHPEFPFDMVLGKLGEVAREQGRMLRYEQPRLILVLDQLEELFTSERVSAKERTAFSQLLLGLVRSKLVWVIATMRSDFWHRVAEVPEVIELADGEGRLDLLPPSPSEISQMIQRPAELAAIHFEAHPETAVPLNDVIAEEAGSDPGTLPLLSYLLDQLYQRDIQASAGDTLTYGSYNGLGGLKGAITRRADSVIAQQPPEVRESLRGVLFTLVQMTKSDGEVEQAVARRAALSDFPAGTPKRRLIDALLDPSARLLVADAGNSRPSTVRLAHEALITEWQVARDYVADNAKALKRRRALEEYYARWQSLNDGDEPAEGATLHGLLQDVALDDAIKLLRLHRDSLTPELIAYIDLSRGEGIRSAQQPLMTLRVLLCAAGDVAAARELAVQAIEKTSRAYAQSARIEPHVWVPEPMLAHGHFDNSPPRPGDFDVVVFIVESKLGALMPERTEVAEHRGADGRAPISEMKWVLENALSAAHDHGAPAVLLYRSTRRVAFPLEELRGGQTFLQLEAVDAFCSDFEDKALNGSTYATFGDLEELSVKLERDLRGCIQRYLRKARSMEQQDVPGLWPSNPFRGLEAYEYEHAPIFFGRNEAIATALARLMGNAQTGRPFLLVVGASGSGKSSLVKAGLLPQLLLPHRVPATAFLRRCVFRPDDVHTGEDFFDALARCLTTGDGVTTGLPELLGGLRDTNSVAIHLRENRRHPEMPLAQVLDQLGLIAREEGKILQYEQPKLILELDQLDGLLSSNRMQHDEDRAFLQCVAALVRSGLVWVIASMRTSAWHQASQFPEFLELADGEGTFHLLPPTPAEFNQVVRSPALAAAITFEAHPVTGVPLSDEIAGAAVREAVELPLLGYLLDQLYRSDIQVAGGNALTYSTYNMLGGISGAITTRADRLIASQPSEVRQALRSVLFSLVQLGSAESDPDRAVARRAQIGEFPPGTPRRQLIEAMLDPSARLLVADAQGGEQSTVRLAHDGLIYQWAPIRDFVVASGEALKVRRLLEDRYSRWQVVSGQIDNRGKETAERFEQYLRRLTGSERGLLADLDLADGRRLLQDYREFLTPQLALYVGRSLGQERRKRQGALSIRIAAAATLAFLTIAVIHEAKEVQRARTAAAESSTGAHPLVEKSR
jgi:energy-coupling factor transporter ATP-binding protein EcfA2